MMRILAAFLVTFVGALATAHIEQGTYQGKTPDGKNCSMIAGDRFFEGGLVHPLNERIPITIDGVLYNVGHPSTIDSTSGTVTFNHDFFRSLSPTATGAKAIEILMEHSNSYEGPRSFTAMEDFWSAKKQVLYHCNDLKKTTR